MAVQGSSTGSPDTVKSDQVGASHMSFTYIMSVVGALWTTSVSIINKHLCLRVSAPHAA